MTTLKVNYNNRVYLSDASYEIKRKTDSATTHCNG
jgi:hypothetical protein